MTNKPKECECCGWDDRGYQHEPFCPYHSETQFSRDGRYVKKGDNYYKDGELVHSETKEGHRKVRELLHDFEHELAKLAKMPCSCSETKGWEESEERERVKTSELIKNSWTDFRHITYNPVDGFVTLGSKQVAENKWQEVAGRGKTLEESVANFIRLLDGE